MKFFLSLLIIVMLFNKIQATIYGLVLSQNPPSMVSLSQFDETSGNITILGPKHSELDGMGDLSTIDMSNKIFYYLGDTSSGTTLVGLSLTTGVEICRGVIQLVEQGFVGFGQSIDFDHQHQKLLLTGLNSNGTHSVYVTKGCVGTDLANVTKQGVFGDASYIPMLHSSALDEDHQRLYVSVAPTKDTVAVGMIDLRPGSHEMITLIPEEGISNQLVGMQYDKVSEAVIGVLPDGAGGLYLNTLNVDKQGLAI